MRGQFNFSVHCNERQSTPGGVDLLHDVAGGVGGGMKMQGGG